MLFYIFWKKRKSLLRFVSSVWRMDEKGEAQPAIGCESIKKRFLFLHKLLRHCSFTVSLASLKAAARSVEAPPRWLISTALTETDRCAKTVIFLAKNNSSSLSFFFYFFSVPFFFFYGRVCQVLHPFCVFAGKITVSIRVSAPRLKSKKIKSSEMQEEEKKKERMNSHNWIFIFPITQNTTYYIFR